MGIHASKQDIICVWRDFQQRYQGFDGFDPQPHWSTKQEPFWEMDGNEPADMGYFFEMARFAAKIGTSCGWHGPWELQMWDDEGQ